MKTFLQILFINLLFYNNPVSGQSNFDTAKFYFQSGIGPVISFHGQSKPPFQYSNLKEYSIKKNTVGTTIDLAGGMLLKKNWTIGVRFSDQRFSNSYNIMDTISNTNYEYTFIGKLYRHQQYYQIETSKLVCTSQNHNIGVGIGLFLIRDSEQFTAQYAGIGNFNPNASLHEYPNLEGGTSINIFGEKKIGRNIFLGLKSQLYYIISVDSFEAISLNPYIKMLF